MEVFMEVLKKLFLIIGVFGFLLGILVGFLIF
jgi:hypothetical protein